MNKMNTSAANINQFYVVVTAEWAAAVPSNWVFPEIMTVWWPKGETITMAIAKNREPSGSWNESVYQYLIGPFDTYVEVRNNEKRAICISTDDDTEALRSTFPSDGNKRERKNNRQDDFLYASDLAPKNFKRKKITTKEAVNKFK
ncbi:unnamed protein product [Lasius platythorax]|uniref:Uncharacterized protein n=1 Tax=Lasius platythorax TaxID=488582 RepID=A0AAV2NPF8_9HYME